jgi:LacI family repressor for deo operon, udp, cdd, tsx, nupC, and nupG
VPPEPGSLGDPLPTVLIDAEAKGYSSVRLDSEGGAASAVQYLLDIGHRRIGHLAAPFGQMPFTLRRAGLEETVAAAGLDPGQVARAVADPFTLDGGEAAGRELLSGPDRPTAIVCDDDLIASGLLRAARELGLSVPGDLSVVGFDDVDLARLVTPPLTTVHADARRLGATSFALLAGHLADPAAKTRQLIEPVELVVRGSTGPPPG